MPCGNRHTQHPSSGEKREITKREAVIAQLVNESAGANLRATKMLIDMMKDIEKKTGAGRHACCHRLAASGARSNAMAIQP